MMADAKLLASYRAACAQLGELVPYEVYADHVRNRLGAETPSAEVAADLLLACACLAASETALAELDRRYLAQVPQFVSKLESSPAAHDEIAQRLRERLLVGAGDRRPKLADYTGRGRLGSWLRVVTIRLALDLRAANKETLSEGAAEHLLAADDPELEYLRARYARQFHDAFVEALGALEPRERTVLRLHLIDGLNVDRIGQLHDVHRATAARWLAAAREQLFQRTRDVLRRELGISATEFASIVRLVKSDLDVSICRILMDQA